MKRENTRQGFMQKTCSPKGFTLIELLVVILIVGILAAVALPQYNKAIRKARLAEVHSTLNTLMKGIDMYALQNGFPEKNASVGPFVGGTATIDLDIDIGGNVFNNTNGLYTKIGRWYASCSWPGYSDSPRCSISLDTKDNANQESTNTWLNKITITWAKPANGIWLLDSVQRFNNGSYVTTGDGIGDVCRWWESLYGTDHMSDNAKTTCANN